MPEFPQQVHALLVCLEAAGFAAYLVGGCVRDLLMGRQPVDWDAATSARPEQVLELFAPDALPTGLQHGTVTVSLDGCRFEVTTFRRDGNYRDSRHPDHVEFTASLEEDLSRRDFTVNAMAMDRGGRLIDPFGGQEDLRYELLRCVGDPDRRLTEDALRIMRGLRFAATLGLAVDGPTAGALHRHRALLGEIAVERIAVELKKLLCGRAAADILLEYADVLAVVIPEIAPAIGFQQHNPHHCFDVWEHSVRALAAVPPDPIARFVLLLHDLGKPETFFLDEAGVGHFYNHGKASAEIAQRVCQRLRLDRHTSETVERLVRWHDVEIPLTEKGIRRQLRRLGETDLRRLLQVKRGDNLAQHPAYLGRQTHITQLEQLLEVVLQEQQCFSLKQMAVKGGDLLALGLSGRAVGETLDALLDQVVEGKLPNDRELLLLYVKEKLL